MSAHATYSYFIKYAKVLLIFKNSKRKVVKFFKTERGVLYDTDGNKYTLKKIRSITYYDVKLDSIHSI